MKKSTDSTLDSDIDLLLSNDKTVIVMSGSPSCHNCEITKNHILGFINKNKTNNLGFIYVDNSTDFKVESKYYEMDEMDDYPKSIIYHQSINQYTFHEGIFTKEELSNLNRLD